MLENGTSCGRKENAGDAVVSLTRPREGEMLLEVLLVLLLIGAVAATLLTFFIRGDKKSSASEAQTTIDTDNPQRDI